MKKVRTATPTVFVPKAKSVTYDLSEHVEGLNRCKWREKKRNKEQKGKDTREEELRPGTSRRFRQGRDKEKRAMIRPMRLSAPKNTNVRSHMRESEGSQGTCDRSRSEVGKEWTVFDTLMCVKGYKYEYKEYKRRRKDLVNLEPCCYGVEGHLPHEAEQKAQS